jgi:pimeloyl-ACP methyl ester carboxylesterase
MTVTPAEQFADDNGWRRRSVRTNGVSLHCVEAGDPASQRIVLLLHGFPEFWYAWRRLLGPLGAAGLRAIAPDLRGYNLSGKPPRVMDYAMAELVADVVGIVREANVPRVTLVGHDWGGIIAWQVAMRHPELLDRLVILNAPHPAAFDRELRRSTTQWLRSTYVLAFQLPWLPEAILRANDWHLLRRMMRHDPVVPGAFSRLDIDRYAAALARPRALASALNYYRALSRVPAALADVRRIDTPTLVFWGDHDKYLVGSLAEGLETWVPSVRVERLPDASHWLHHERPTEVLAKMVDFING